MLLWPTLLFGLTHSLNLLAGHGGLETLVQILYAFAIGFVFTVLRLRGNSLWPLVIWHMLTDLAVFLAQGGIGANVEVTTPVLLFPAILAVAYVLWGIAQLRKVVAEHRTASAQAA